MIKKKSLFIQPLLRSFIPSLIGGTSFLLKELLSNCFFATTKQNLQRFNLTQTLDHTTQNYGTSPEGLITDSLAILSQISFTIYTNFFCFLLVMLMIDIFFKIAQAGAKGFNKEAKLVRMTIDPTGSEREGRFFNLVSENQLIRILCYVVIFLALQTTGLYHSETSKTPHPYLVEATESSQGTGKISQMMTRRNTEQEEEDFFGISRILEEKEGWDTKAFEVQDTSFKMLADKVSLSMGNILSTLHIDVNEMILSKDRKTAFVILEYYGTLNIVDISDLKAPIILGSLNLKMVSSNFKIKTLALSSDEKTLYASNFVNLEIIDISDFRSPKLVSLTENAISISSSAIKDAKLFKISLAVDERRKTLFIGGPGLQVYDISDPQKPDLLKSFKDRFNRYETLLKNEICLSHDGEVLFVANGTLEIYNISNPKEIRQLYSLNTKSSPRSIFLSKDGKTAFLLGTSLDKEIILEEADISDYHSVSIRSTYKLLGYKSKSSPRFVAVYPSETKFFILSDSELLIFDSVKKTTIKNEKSLIEDAFAMNFSVDGRSLITGANNQFMTIELFLDYPNSQIFSESLESLISNFSLPTSCVDFQISKDEQFLFALRKKFVETNFLFIFEIWDLTNISNPRLLSSYNCKEYLEKIHVTNNEKTVYLMGRGFILGLDIDNKSSIIKRNSYEAEYANHLFYFLTTSSNGEMGFLINRKNGSDCLTFLNLSSSIEGFMNLDMKLSTRDRKVILKDDQTLILLEEGIIIYDISDLHSPTKIASLSFGINEPLSNINSAVLSSDNKTLFIQTSDLNYFRKLKIYNVSIPRSFHLINEIYLSRAENTDGNARFSLSADLKMGFVLQKNFLVKLNLANSKQPEVSGIIRLHPDKKKAIDKYVISSDSKNIYVSIGNTIRVLNMNIEYTLYLNQEKFLLGEKYSDKVLMLHLTGGSDYSVIDKDDFKIIKVSLLDMKIAPNKHLLELTNSPLPYWMAFDQENNILTVESKKRRELGTYTLRSVFSFKIPIDIFNGLGTTNEPISSEDLIAWLVSLDYVDNQLFLTKNFGPLEAFYLPIQFQKYKTQIHQILKMFYVETSTLFEIRPSLEFKDVSGNLVVSSLSTNQIKVEIKVLPQEGSDVAKFLKRPYASLLPQVRENKTKVYLEGTMKEINSALQSVVMNFENQSLSQNANVTIIDGLNTPLTVELRNISRYFKSNEPPKQNNRTGKTVQEQITRANFQTGSYLSVTLDEDTFEDENCEDLTYDVTMAKNETAFPNWLSFSGLTLKGTPPEEIFGRDVDLIYIARNEFKELRVPFRLHAKISSAFVMKLLIRYSPYILTAVGLLVNFNRIFSILAKKKYKHLKEFTVGIGEEITPEVIFPILFIGKETKESELILNHLKNDKEIVKGENILTNFIDPDTQELNKQKIHEIIGKVKIDASPIVYQIITNKFVFMQLNTKKEIQTKRLFEELLKNTCLEVVERDSSSPGGFTINQNKLNEMLQARKIVSDGDTKHSEDLEESLISNSNSIPEGVNMELLKDAILAFAFEEHSLLISPARINITVRQKVQSNFLFRFLKIDLKEISFNDNNKMDFGINYRISDDKLYFYGTTQNYFKDKTIVVQIKNRRQKIMKEIWISGVSASLQGSVQGDAPGYQIL